jgi:DNA-binding Lrp family transcriptional regulator
MGRPKKQIDEMTLLGMRSEKKRLVEISRALGVSIPTLSRRLAVLHHEKGILTKYRALQGLELTGLQARILEAVDAKTFENGSLIELINSFHVLTKAEKSIQGKESFKVYRLLDHLRIMETLE